MSTAEKIAAFGVSSSWLIDDARLFTGDYDYPTIKTIRDIVCSNCSKMSVIVKDDIIRISSKKDAGYDRSKND